MGIYAGFFGERQGEGYGCFCRGILRILLIALGLEVGDRGGGAAAGSGTGGGFLEGEAAVAVPGIGHFARAAGADERFAFLGGCGVAGATPASMSDRHFGADAEHGLDVLAGGGAGKGDGWKMAGVDGD